MNNTMRTSPIHDRTLPPTLNFVGNDEARARVSAEGISLLWGESSFFGGVLRHALRDREIRVPQASAGSLQWLKSVADRKELAMPNQANFSEVLSMASACCDDITLRFLCAHLPLKYLVLHVAEWRDDLHLLDYAFTRISGSFPSVRKEGFLESMSKPESERFLETCLFYFQHLGQGQVDDQARATASLNAPLMTYVATQANGARYDETLYLRPLFLHTPAFQVIDAFRGQPNPPFGKTIGDAVAGNATVDYVRCLLACRPANEEYTEKPFYDDGFIWRGYHTALASATISKKAHIVEQLLLFGAHPDRGYSNSIEERYCHTAQTMTPLYFAAREGDSKSVKVLLAHGASPSRGTEEWDARKERSPFNQVTPYEAAHARGHHDTAAILELAAPRPWSTRLRQLLPF